MIWFIAILTVIVVLTVLVSLRVHRNHSDGLREFYGNEPAYIDRDEETLTNFREINSEMHRKYDTRTLAELASECPACGGDHTGNCGVVATLADNDVITGTIVKIEDIPAQPQQTETLFIRHPETSERVSGLLAVMDEIEYEWHRIGGAWHAPASRLESLPEDDWLRQLLTEPVAV